MIRTSFLHPMIDAAARLGEDIVCARLAQKAFERRSVHKYAFTVAPVSGRRARATGGSDGGNGAGGKGLVAVLPDLGQIVSVGEGGSALVCHREGLSLSYLRRSFLRIGRAAILEKVRSGCEVDLRQSFVCFAFVVFWDVGYSSFPVFVFGMATVARLPLDAGGGCGGIILEIPYHTSTTSINHARFSAQPLHHTSSVSV